MPLETSVQEALKILGQAEERRIALRLIGGLAFSLRCPSAKRASLARAYGDIDLLGRRKESERIGKLLSDLGYVGRERFNALQGQQRLIFDDPVNKRRVDVFLDVFEMCHKFDFSRRIELDRYTLSLADLLLTKLQVVELTSKDIKDMVSLFLDYDLGSGDGPLINGEYVASLCGARWGVCKTFTVNLEKLREQVGGLDLTEGEQRLVVGRLDRLKGMIEAAPKGTGWRMRASVGEKVRWYELPEETLA